MSVIVAERLRKDVTAAGEESRDALQAVADYGQTVTSLERQLVCARDADETKDEQVQSSLVSNFQFRFA